MSTTPPKKGKKRAPPSTPTGRPPAKASRASSPARPGEDAPSGFASTFNPSVLPAIPPFRPPAGSSAGLQPAFKFTEETSEQEEIEPEGLEPDNDDDTLA